jgi:hypothetical protein
MLSDQDFQSVKNFYAEEFRLHGTSAKGAAWNSQESQYIRFEQLLKLNSNPDEAFSITDYGSGYGALVQYMVDRGLKFTYKGYDTNADAVEEGHKLFSSLPNCTFTADDKLLTPCDYFVTSGIFNMKVNTPADEWEKYMLGTLDRLWELSIKGMAFNVLTKYSDADKMRPELYYADPCFLFDYCKMKFSRQVALLHDYGIYDFTILVRR